MVGGFNDYDADWRYMIHYRVITKAFLAYNSICDMFIKDLLGKYWIDIIYK